jgi:GAF domain-containing protein
VDEDLIETLERIYARSEPQPVDRAALAAQAELEAIGADAAFVAVRGKGGSAIEVARVTRFSRSPIRLAFAVDAPYPLAEVLRRGKELFVASNEQLACDHPGLVRVNEEDHACATIPLRSGDGELIGALNLGFEDPHEFTEAERQAIGRLAERCATVLAESRPAE